MPKFLQSVFAFVRTYFALLVVFAVFLWSAWVIATYRAQQTPPGSTVIRLGHWQLEASVREGIDSTDEAGDADTADLLTGLSRMLDKQLWMLEAHLD